MTINILFPVFAEVHTVVQNFRSGISDFRYAGMPVLMSAVSLSPSTVERSLPRLMFMHVCKRISPPAQHGLPVVCIHTIRHSCHHTPYLFQLNSWQALQLPARGRRTTQSVFFQTLTVC